MNPRYLEDFAVGQTFSTDSASVSADDIKQFAAAYDPQPFHLDEQAAESTVFRGLVASGWHTAALTMRLIVQSRSGPLGGVVGAGSELTWPRPVRPGDELHVDGEVIEVRQSRSRPEQGIVRIRMTTRNQRGEPVQVMVANLVVPRREAAG